MSINNNAANSILGDVMNAVHDVVSPKPKAEVKPAAAKKEVVKPLSGQSYVAVAATAGGNLAKAYKMELDAAAIKKEINDSIKLLHSHKVVIGRKGKCPVATAFYDAMIDGGLAKGTAANYLSVFRDYVKTGKEVKDWNKDRATTAKTEAKTKEPKSFAEVFVKAFNFADGQMFKDLCMEIQNGFEDAQHDSIYAGFQDYLMFQGVELKDVEDKE